MLLAIDIGNSEIVAGVFSGEDLVAEVRLHTDERLTRDELGVIVTQMLTQRGVSTSGIDAVVVSSVVPGLNRAIADAAEVYFSAVPLMVGPGVRTGLRILYDDPRQVGADRIVNAVAALHRHGGPAVLIDFGTATTFDALNGRGDYLGGAIAPGVAISLEALVTRAAKLNRVPLVAPPGIIGRTTTTSMQSGLIFGYVGLVEGITTRMRAELGKTTRVIATGGLAHLIAEHTGAIDVVDQTLTLTGLRLIHELNAE